MIKSICSYENELIEVNKLIASHKSLVSAFSRLFGNSDNKINEHNNRHKLVTSNLDSARKSFNEARKQLISLWDYWPTYPPDWGERSSNIREGQIKCEKCRKKTDRSHVHHIITLSQGGSNKDGNLERLCEQCHSKKHGGRELDKISTGTNNSRFENRLEIIEQAIRQKKTISFHYEKYGGESSNRKILPTKIENYEHYKNDGNTLCVEGHCYMRNARRVFAIKRMTRLRID
ncbi:MAG: HNH endonuclease [Geobacteraceae bacterium]|nr:HNH endonuclease [Geobacteraceae bacterium]